MPLFKSFSMVASSVVKFVVVDGISETLIFRIMTSGMLVGTTPLPLMISGAALAVKTRLNEGVQ